MLRKFSGNGSKQIYVTKNPAVAEDINVVG